MFWHKLLRDAVSVAVRTPYPDLMDVNIMFFNSTRAAADISGVSPKTPCLGLVVRGEDTDTSIGVVLRGHVPYPPYPTTIGILTIAVVDRRY